MTDNSKSLYIFKYVHIRSFIQKYLRYLKKHLKRDLFLIFLAREYGSDPQVPWLQSGHEPALLTQHRPDTQA